MQADWELSQSFVSDGQGFRCACVLPPSDDSMSFRLLAGTQGGSLWEFQVPSGKMLSVDFQQNHAVTAILASLQGGNVFVTGCKDSQIRVFSSKTHELLFALEGHDKAVTSLDWADDEGNFLVSGSWDGTAKIWNLATKSLVATMNGHENTVSVCGLKMRDSLLNVATGSAGAAVGNRIVGHTTRLWSINTRTGEATLSKAVQNDHEGPIRDICITGSGFLATCSNDGTVRLRSPETASSLLTLTCLAEDPPMLLSVTGVGDNMVAASAEDGHVIVWPGGESDGGRPQLLRHSSSVWDVLALPENDIATCCQDGMLRIFTQSIDRRAPEKERASFSMKVQEAISKQQAGPSTEDIAKLPQWQMNSLQQGKKEGQVQLFQKDGKAIAAQWSMISHTWIEVGEVVSNPSQSGGGGSGMSGGAQYDFVFPIEVDQPGGGGGVKKLQIGYNTGENPFVSAQRFIDTHMLPQYHLTEIADYITQRAGASTPTLGAGGGLPSATVGVPNAVYQYLPAKSYKSFTLTKATNFEKLQTKVSELNQLSETQIHAIRSLCVKLSTTNRYHAAVVTREEFDVVRSILRTALPAQAFPALDLARLTVLIPSASSNTAYWTEIVGLALQMTELATEGTPAVAVPMLALRLIANVVRAGARSSVFQHIDGVLACTDRFKTNGNKYIRLSVATVLLNIALYVQSTKSMEAVGPVLVQQIDSILDNQVPDSETMIRLLMALGTIVMGSPEAKDVAKTLFLVSKVERRASPHGDMCKNIAREVYALLSR